MSVFFNGVQLTTPVTASAVNDDAMLNQNLSVGNAIAFVGVAKGGEPQKVLAFGSPNEAKATLISGELCDAVVAAFAPSGDTGAPQTIYAVRVNDSTPAFLDLKNKDQKVVGTLKGKTFSANDKLISLKVEAGDLTGLSGPLPGIDLISTTLGYLDASGIPQTAFAKNVNMPILMVTLKADNVGFAVAEKWFRIVTNYHQANEQVIDVHYADFPTVEAITKYVNTMKDDAGTPFVELVVDSLDLHGDLPSDMFDEVVFKDKDVTHYIPSNAYLIQQWVASVSGSTVEYIPAPRAVTALSPVPMTTTYLAQPAGSAPTATDWSNALDRLQYKDVQWVQAVSGNPAVHAKIVAHCEFCSNTLHKERRAICGTVAGTTDEDAIKAAKAINSKRVSLVHIGHYDFDAQGKLALRPAYMTAGLVAAAFAGVNPGTPLTNKSLRVQGLERDLLNPTDTDLLLKGGVMPIENTENGYKVTQSITTWLGDSKYNNREQSCGVAIDFTIRNVRQAVDPLRGSKQSPLLLSRAVSLAESALKELARPEPQGPAVLVGDEKYPAYRNITASIEGDVLRLQFEASPAIPNNYILVTMYAVPYSGSATA